jgi:hypothetical protein
MFEKAMEGSFRLPEAGCIFVGDEGPCVQGPFDFLSGNAIFVVGSREERVP